MSNLDELISTADRLCKTLEESAENENKFCYDLCIELEKYSHQVYKMMNNIKELKEIYGG